MLKWLLAYEKQFMLMVIFGAGASFDSSPTYPIGMAPPGSGDMGVHNDYYRPPLAKDLFANRPMFIDAVESFPQCKTIVPRLRDPSVRSGQVSIETRLQEIEKEAATYVRGKIELAAVRCYLQRAISECDRLWKGATKGITNYLSLLREIDRLRKNNEPVCLVTFNYDTLIEDALELLGHKINHMEDYTDRGAIFQLFKLHGSINWAHVVENGVPANVNATNGHSVLQFLIEHASDIRFSNRTILCSPVSMGAVSGNLTFPAIAIPVEQKSLFQCPGTMIDELKRILPQVTKILVIGWRAAETHFLDLLKHHLRLGTYVSIVVGGQAEATDVRVKIHTALLNNPPESREETTGFTEFIRSGRAVEFLAA